MEFINATRMAAAYTLGTEPSARESLIVVIKGTFNLPRPGEQVTLKEPQLPLVTADTFTGEAGFSAPYQEADFSPAKQFCDVLLQGSAYAPQGRPAGRVAVALRVGNWSKVFAVVGDRRWQPGIAGFKPGEPEPFAAKPFSYDVAFGGIDRHHPDPAEHAAFMRNPVGCGFHRHLKPEWVDGSPLPNTEQLDDAVTAPDGDYAPMAFGPLGRNWDPRRGHAGTYDREWLSNQFPFLPTDFDNLYYQSAPTDQQIPIPRQGMQVSLHNLTPDGARAFMLPCFEAPVYVFPRSGEREDLLAALDTLVFEPDQERFTMTWRLARPLQQDLFEIDEVLVGRKGPEWWQQRDALVLPIQVFAGPLGR